MTPLKLQKLADVQLGPMKMRMVVFLDTRTGLVYRCDVNDYASWSHYYSQKTSEYTDADHACADRIVAKSEPEPLFAAVRRLVCSKIDWET